MCETWLFVCCREPTPALTIWRCAYCIKWCSVSVLEAVSVDLCAGAKQQWDRMDCKQQQQAGSSRRSRVLGGSCFPWVEQRARKFESRWCGFGAAGSVSQMRWNGGQASSARKSFQMGERIPGELTLLPHMASDYICLLAYMRSVLVLMLRHHQQTGEEQLLIGSWWFFFCRVTGRTLNKCFAIAHVDVIRIHVSKSDLYVLIV